MTAQAQAARHTLRILPLGGLGEVGMNCMVVEYGDEALLIDCGVTFPDSPDFGVDLVLPGWQYVLDNVERFSAIVLTHGHEDHIGALPFLLAEVDIPVYGTELTLALLGHKLREHQLLDQCQLIRVEAGDRVSLETLDVEFVHVNHSMPQATAVVLHTDLGAVVHTGDWRIDEAPVRGETTDFARLGAIGDAGVLCLLGDSTNVEAPGTPISESAVIEGLEAVIAAATGRVFVTQFSSNVYRLLGLMEIAARTGRTLFVAGRSLERMLDTAADVGLIEADKADAVGDIRYMDSLDPSEVLVACTGSQGEQRSALARIARGEFKKCPISAGDTVVFSARVVPGNEMPVSRVQNALWERGVEVITPRDAPIHTTGHAHREDMARMLDVVRPAHVVPIHGELRMLIKHARLAGAPGRAVHLLRNGESLVLSGTCAEDVSARLGEIEEAGRILMDEGGVSEITFDAVRDRRRLARGGVLIVFAVLDPRSGTFVHGPEIVQYGAVDEEVSGALEQVRAHTAKVVSQLGDVSDLGEVLRLAVRRWFRLHQQRKPIVIPIVRTV